MEVEMKNTEGNTAEILGDMAVRLGHFPPGKSQKGCNRRRWIRSSGRQFIPQKKKQSTPVEFLCCSVVLSNFLNSLRQKRTPICNWQKIKNKKKQTIQTSWQPRVLRVLWFLNIHGAHAYVLCLVPAFISLIMGSVSFSFYHSRVDVPE